FGYALPNVTREPMVPEPTPTPHLGDQVRGFGFLHDGSIPTLFNFFRVRFFPIAPFTFPDQPGRSGNQKVRELEAFLLTFDTGLAPVVGHQVTLDSSSLEARLPRYNVLRARADAGDCDLVAHAIFEGGERRAYLYTGGGNLLSDREAESTTEVALRSAIENDGAIITVTAVPPGTGRRIALDRDEDGAFDGDEIDFGSDPADPTSVPFAGIAFLRGNCNGDGTLDLADAVFGLGFLFQGGSEPVCRESCDANGDGRHDLSDAVYTLGFLFLGTPAPGAYPECESVSENCATNVCP
ncbi:MAG TPA: hypothetical protein VK116_08000, partial [Planctomycetota bacterium]|nr:hypothetical protein [Planctomycetota bacterium]